MNVALYKEFNSDEKGTYCELYNLRVAVNVYVVCDQTLMSAARVHITVNMVSTAQTNKDRSVVQVQFYFVFSASDYCFFVLCSYFLELVTVISRCQICTLVID